MVRERYEELQAKEGRRCPYIVHVHLAAAKLPSRAALVAALRASCGRVDPMGSEDDFLAFAYPDHMTTFAEGVRVPAQHIFTLLDDDAAADMLEPALQQTWEWSGARDAVHGARATLLMNDMMASGVDPHARLDLFQRALRATLPLLPAVAIHWLPSQRIVEPGAYLRADPDLGRVSSGPVNVRLFRVEGREPGECIMDTLGMAAFDLPDLQCHFIGLDPGRIAARLYGYATYVFAKGDIIADGNTVEGLEPGRRWVCRHEASLAEPRRVVVDMNPGRA